MLSAASLASGVTASLCKISLSGTNAWVKALMKLAQSTTLTLAEIYAALSYNFDHQDEVNQSIRESEAFVQEM